MKGYITACRVNICCILRRYSSDPFSFSFSFSVAAAHLVFRYTPYITEKAMTTIRQITKKAISTDCSPVLIVSYTGSGL